MTKFKNDSALIASARKWFHEQLVAKGVLVVDSKGIPSNSDKDNDPSCEIGKLIAYELHAKQGRKLSGQTAGKRFEKLVCDYINMTFPKLQHLRPGNWKVENLGNKNAVKTSSFVQYEHLAHLATVIKTDKQLATMLGNDYVVAPDIVVSMTP